MNKYAASLALAACIALAACSQSGSQRALPFSQDRIAGGIVHGNFTEYTLPAAANPTNLIKGPSNTLWFVEGQSDLSVNLYRFDELTAAVTAYTNPGPAYSAGNLVGAGNAFYFLITEPVPPPGYNDNVASATFAGVMTFGSSFGFEQVLGNAAIGPGGRIWYPYCQQDCQAIAGDYVGSVAPNGTPGPSALLPTFSGNDVAPGPGGDLYVSASYDNALPPPANDSALFVVSGTGTVLHQYNLPHGSNPQGLVEGPDHNMWVTEPGTNQIARVTPSGVITQFTVPTASAGAANITIGFDGALWFTETGANKVGRITTSGAVHEFAIPTANSGASVILRCQLHCGAHYGVWFAETNANQLAKFDSPL